MVLDFRPMWRVRIRRSRRPPSKPSAGAPPTSPRWRTLASTAWCCCSPTEMVNNLFFFAAFPVLVRSVWVWTVNIFAETVVAESVVVIKKLLQTQPSQHSEIIKHMAKLFDNITVCFTSLLFTLIQINIRWQYNNHTPVSSHFVPNCRSPWLGPASCGWWGSTARGCQKSPLTSCVRWQRLSRQRKISWSCKPSI